MPECGRCGQSVPDDEFTDEELCVSCCLDYLDEECSRIRAQLSKILPIAAGGLVLGPLVLWLVVNEVVIFAIGPTRLVLGWTYAALGAFLIFLGVTILSLLLYKKTAYAVKMKKLKEKRVRTL